MKVVTSAFRRLTVFARPLVPTHLSPDLDIQIEIRNLSLKELDAYRALRPDQSTAYVAHLLESGASCTVIWHRNRIVHAAWAYQNRAFIPYLNRDMILQDKDILVLDSYTLTEYRRKSLTKARAAFQSREFASRGLRRSLGLVAVENKPGLAAVLGVGYRTLGVYKYLRAGPWSRYWEQPVTGEIIPRLALPGSDAVS